MAMRPCGKCLENNWSYQHIEGYVRATCKLCGHEVEFPTKKTRRKLLQAEQAGELKTMKLESGYNKKKGIDLWEILGRQIKKTNADE